MHVCSNHILQDSTYMQNEIVHTCRGAAIAFLGEYMHASVTGVFVLAGVFMARALTVHPLECNRSVYSSSACWCSKPG